MKLLQSEKRAIFDELYRELLNGSESAAMRIIELYYDAILHRLRLRLSPAMRSKFDTVDIAQSVVVGLATKADVMSKLDSPDRFIAYAIKCAKRNMQMKYRRFAGTQARNINREQRISDVYERRGRLRKKSVLKNSLHDRSSQPASAVAMAREEWKSLWGACNKSQRQVLELKLSGLKSLEIAERLGIADRTVRHTLQQISEMYYRECAR